MAKALVAVAAILFVLMAQLPLGLTFSTGPAFLWSPNLDGKKGMVDYRVLSPRDMAKSALKDGGWWEYMCPGEEAQALHPKNFAFLFIGSELQSLDISRPSNADPSLIHVLKDSFLNSNLSLAFPYIAVGEEKVSVESSLISELADTCQHEFDIALVGSCSVDGENVDKLDRIDSVYEYLKSRIEKSEGRRNLIVLCPGASDDSESSIISQLLNNVNQLGAKYSVLYISDPFRSVNYFSHGGLERFLGEGNASPNSTVCDGICQTKATLLEGILVGVVLLVILISGLCCMMGIDTPTRFETPQDS